MTSSMPHPPVSSSRLLARALAASSARLSPRPAHWRSTAIHAAVFGAWLLSVVLALGGRPWLGWTVGIVYVFYDTFLLGLVFWNAGGSRVPQVACPAEERVGRRLSICVVIAARNEAQALPRTLDALFAQDDRPDSILVCDDGSTDSTWATMAGRYGLSRLGLDVLGPPGGPRGNLQWLRLPHGGKARALNAALPATAADLVVTVDADTVLEPGAIRAVRHAFMRESALVAATGVLTPTCGRTPFGRLSELFQACEYLRNFVSRRAWMNLDCLLLVSGAFGAYRRQALLEVGGFDPECQVEDYELIHRLRRHAWHHRRSCRVRVLGDARASTDAPATVTAFLRQRRRWFGGFLQTHYWYREMVGERSLGRLGTLMLPVKAADTMQPLFGLTAWVFLLGYLVAGRLDVVGTAAAVMAGKLVIDLTCQVALLRSYRRWTGCSKAPGVATVLLAGLLEPFTFQILRHLGAAGGWLAVVRGRQTWGRSSRGSEFRPQAQQPLYGTMLPSPRSSREQ